MTTLEHTNHSCNSESGRKGPESACAASSIWQNHLLWLKQLKQCTPSFPESFHLPIKSLLSWLNRSPIKKLQSRRKVTVVSVCGPLFNLTDLTLSCTLKNVICHLMVPPLPHFSSYFISPCSISVSFILSSLSLCYFHSSIPSSFDVLDSLVLRKQRKMVTHLATDVFSSNATWCFLFTAMNSVKAVWFSSAALFIKIHSLGRRFDLYDDRSTKDEWWYINKEIHN